MNRLPVVRLLLLVLPIAFVGLFGRVFYTPDEPREGSLVAAMAVQPSKALPELAGRPFAEKPPLLYWLGGASVAALGDSPAAARVPNLLYLLVAVLAIAALASRAAGTAAGFAAGIVCATALQLYQVEIWLATDAPLLAGVALALFGAYVGLTAQDRGTRTVGYLAFNAGLAIAFFAKGLAGWLVPGTAFVTVLVLERRWRELLRPELWFGAPLLLLAIGAWIWAVDELPDGRESLKIMFWYNLVGRAVPLSAPAGFAYASGHQNSMGKYLLELPLYLWPWCALALAAVRRSLRGARAPDEAGTAWRLALGAIVPATLLLSLAATARGVYYGPPALGFALLIGLYVGSAATALDRTDRLCWRVTGWLIALLALVATAVAVLVSFAPASRDAASVALGVIALVSGLAAVWLALRPAVFAAGAFPRQALAVALVLTTVLAPTLRPLNAWQSLGDFAEAIRTEAEHRPLIFLDADETTIAMASLSVPPAERLLLLEAGDPAGAERAAAALTASGGAARVVWLVPGIRRWRWPDWLGFLGYRPWQRSAETPELPSGLGKAEPVCRLERPGGRAVAILAPAGAAPIAATRCR